eukprot:1808382-Prymnesium_polylepis.1
MRECVRPAERSSGGQSGARRQGRVGCASAGALQARRGSASFLARTARDASVGSRRGVGVAAHSVATARATVMNVEERARGRDACERCDVDWLVLVASRESGVRGRGRCDGREWRSRSASVQAKLPKGCGEISQ